MASLFSPIDAQPIARVSATNSSNDAFLNEVEHGSWQFFNLETNKINGLIPDRAKADGSKGGDLASIASVGFGLTSICVADSRGWIKHTVATRRVLTSLRFFRDKLDQKNGFYHHYYKMGDGSPAADSEISPVDTALFLAGAITAREYFRDPEISSLVNDIYDRIDWPWMLNGGQTFAMAWSPESGFFASRWNSYCELMMIYLLGLGSKTHPLPPATWRAWERGPVGTHYGYQFIECGPLFTHQYTQAFVDFRDKTDGYASYFLNSRYATLAQREMCASLSGRFSKWGRNMWGLSASDSSHGYVAWGGPPADDGLDGTLVPCAPGGSIPFAPAECISVLRQMKESYGNKIWKKYGFVDAFNPQTGWVDTDVIGIDVGITLVQIENQRTGLVWKYFMHAPEIRDAMRIAGFMQGGSLLSNSSLVSK